MYLSPYKSSLRCSETSCSEPGRVSWSSTSRLHSAQSLSTCSGRHLALTYPNPYPSQSSVFTREILHTNTEKWRTLRISSMLLYDTHLGTKPNSRCSQKGVKSLHWKVWWLTIRCWSGTEGVLAKKRCGLSVRTSLHDTRFVVHSVCIIKHLLISPAHFSIGN